MKDPLHIDQDALRALADDRIVRRGLAYFKEHRVIDLGWEPPRLWGTVAGSEPYQVEIEHDGEDLLFDCSCPFRWGPCCKHVVAVLLAYAAKQPVSEARAEDAAAEAIEARVKRGRSEVAVQRVSGDAWPSRWAARAVDAPTSRAPYEVEIRSSDERINTCTCADFGNNRLGTCKHIEAVLHRLRKGGRGNRRVTLDRPVVFLDWRGTQPQIRYEGVRDSDTDRHFDSDGVLRGALPEAFHAVEAELGDRVHVGGDARQLARQIAADAARAGRARRMRATIEASGGRLPGVRAKLYPYQVEGVAFLVAAERAMLADDMGLGKTLQAIAASSWLVDEGRADRVLVVCPASLKHQWAKEIERFTDKSVQIVGGNARARQVQYRSHATYTLVNYELVLRDVSLIRAMGIDVLVLDEAQRIKNWRTKTADAVKTLASRYAFVLTGTPLENRLEDLYSLMQVVDRRVLGPLWQFSLQFHVTDERGKVLGYRNLNELRRRMRPVMLRRDRSLVRDQLPDRIQTRTDLPLDERQRELHDSAMKAAANLSRIMKRRPLTPTEEHQLLAALQTARMACNAAGLVDGESKGSPKLEELRRLLEGLCIDEGRKVVIFSQWKKMTEMVAEITDELSLGCAHLHGGVPSARRGDLTDRFRDDDGTQVFLSTDAGGVGLNLQSATALINLDLPWNPAVLEQRIARVHRLGQREPTHIVLLVAADGYEARISTLLQGKQALFDNVVAERDDADAMGLSKRMLQAAAEAIESQAPDPRDDVEAPEASVEVEPSHAAAGGSLPEAPIDESLVPVVAAVERALGGRIERVLVSRGALLVVARDLTPADHAATEALSSECPIALLDPASFGALGHFTGGIEAAEVAVSAPSQPDVASRKLRAATVLVEQGCASEAFPLLVDGMLTALATRAEVRPPPAHEAATWLFGAAVPAGQVHPDAANAVLRVQALGQAPQVPDALVSAALDDARRLIEGPRC